MSKKFLLKNIVIIFIITFSITLVNDGLALTQNGGTCSYRTECSSDCCLPNIKLQSVKLFYSCVYSGGSSCSIPSNVQNVCYEKKTCYEGFSAQDFLLTSTLAQCGSYHQQTKTSILVSDIVTNFCSVGSFNTTTFKYNDLNKTWSWTCTSPDGGGDKSCFTIKNSIEKISPVCVEYSESISTKPTNLCIVGAPTQPSVVDNKWTWFCRDSNSETSCTASIKFETQTIKSEVNPLGPLINTLNTTGASSSTSGSNSGLATIGSGYTTINIPEAKIVSEYKILEKYSQKCSISFDKDCEVLNSSFLDAINSKLTIKEAVAAGKLNSSWKIARTDNNAKEIDNYETGFTLTNIIKLKALRILPIGFEIAARCIKGEVPCADNKTYSGSGNSCSGDICPKMTDITLKEVLDGYYVCDSQSGGDSPFTGPFCHLVNPNWVLKAPKYRCESGIVFGPLLTATESQQESNIRYEHCPDLSSCISEKDNGDCNAYGYCLREKNIWRFGVGADRCYEDNIGCQKYSFYINNKKNEIGFINNTVDKSMCDESNSGCRKYSTIKSSSRSSDWKDQEGGKIFLNGKSQSCEQSDEGCSAFIRRDTTNLLRNSSFEQYYLSSLDSNSIKIANFWEAINYDDNTNAYVDNSMFYSGSMSLLLRINGSSTKNYVTYKLKDENLIDIEPNKTYTLSYYMLGSGFFNDLKNSTGAYINIKEYKKDSLGNPQRITSTDLNIIDIENLKFINPVFSNTWTRKKVEFKTSLDAEYINILAILSNVKGSSASNYANVVFDSIQLEEGNKLTAYKTYEDSTKMFFKKAPDYMNCYNSTKSDDFLECFNFAKSCDQKDVGCRKYTKKDDELYWIPGKPNEQNICLSECKGYQLYKETGPSYDPIDGSFFQSLISSTANKCSSSAAGCSKYINVNSSQTQYFSNVKQCVKEGVCVLGDKLGVNCLNDSDCGGVVGSCELAQYSDYFTYTGSETSGYKLNVYRLLRSKFCGSGSNAGKKCTNDSDCGTGAGICSYNSYSDSSYSPATRLINVFNQCTQDSYQSINHDPDCREFHGPKNKNSSEKEYILYYANMSEVVPVSNLDCSYYTIGIEDQYISKTKCDKISLLSSNNRYKYSDSKFCVSGDPQLLRLGCTQDSDCGATGVCSKELTSCNIGIFLPESDSCSEAENGCREYKGTSIISEKIFTSNFEGGEYDGWTTNLNTNPITSVESIFVNEHSLKLPYNDSIKKVMIPSIIDSNTKNLYKLSLYAKNSSADGVLSNISLKVGQSTVFRKQVNNSWKLINFGVFNASDLTSVYNSISIINEGLVNEPRDTDLFVDYIVLEKASSEYLIKNTWGTPVSCDNDLSNPTGTCTQEYEDLGFCQLVPNKVYLSGANYGSICIDVAENGGRGDRFADDGSGDVCDYPNKVCISGDSSKLNKSCELNSDCTESGADGTCSYTSSGYRLNLGKMIGCDEYVDPYGNDEFYVFNDLNLCSVDKMGCEALYDTYNSYSAQKQEFNKKENLYDVVGVWAFDNSKSLGIDSSGNGLNGSGNLVYEKNGIYDGAGNFSSSGSLTISLSGTLSPLSGNLAITNRNQKLLTLSSWVKTSVLGANSTIVEKANSYKLGLSGNNFTCHINNSTNLITSHFTLNNSNKDLWHFVVCTYDGTNLNLFIDGKYDNSITLGSDINFTQSNIIIGGGFSGILDDLRIYSRDLDSKEILDLYEDYKDNFIVPADELKYFIIDKKYSCNEKNKGCSALGRREDRYDSYGSYSPVFYIVDPDRFNSSANYSATGVVSGNLCTKEEEGCFTFLSGTSKNNFKFPKNVCIYRDNVNVGVKTLDGKVDFKNGWFKYDYQKSELTDTGCYYNEILKTKTDLDLNTNIENAKKDNNSYKLIKSDDCEYKENVVVRREVVSIGTAPTIYNFKPEQAYYKYDSNNQRTNVKCSQIEIETGYENGNLGGQPVVCKPFGFKETTALIDEYTNTVFSFNICVSGDTNKYGKSCRQSSECGINGKCDAPYVVSGWFKKDSTLGCSDDGDKVCVKGDISKLGTFCNINSDCGVDGQCFINLESSDFIRNYNGSVGICNEYDCTAFIEPSEKVCKSGDKFGYTCTDGECGDGGVCTIDSQTGNRYCSQDGDIYNKKCVFNSDCGFGGSCEGNNTYSYINNDKIKKGGKGGCTTVSRQEGCVLFNDTSNQNLSYASEYTYLLVNQNGGKGVAPYPGDNSGTIKQKDSNVIIKVDRDRDCAEWVDYYGTSLPDKNNQVGLSINNIGTCTSLNPDGTCDNVNGIGVGWNGISNKGLNTAFYLGQMRGDWSNNDFSGYSIYGQKSIDRKTSDNAIPEKFDYWWKKEFITYDKIGENLVKMNPSKDTTSGSIKGTQYVSIDNFICKKYPEKDSPFNASDKYILKDINNFPSFCYKQTACDSNNCVLKKDLDGNGELDENNYATCSNDGLYCCVTLQNAKAVGINANMYKNKSINTYFKMANSGVSVVPSEVSGTYLISDLQECYYNRVKYKNLANDQFYSTSNIPQIVCDEESGGKCVGQAYNLDQVINYLDSNGSDLWRNGYCLEYDLSKEIYYKGSGKYNCILWVPGFAGNSN